MNYYNDNDPKACAWLREIIAATSDFWQIDQPNPQVSLDGGERKT